MLFDTDIFIWVQRGNRRAAGLIDKMEERFLSIQSMMELLQCSQNKKQQLLTRAFIKDYDFNVLPLTENIGHRALIYVEQFTLNSGIRSGDAVIAATAVENNLVLCSSNYRHFKVVPDLQYRRFSP